METGLNRMTWIVRSCGLNSQNKVGDNLGADKPLFTFLLFFDLFFPRSFDANITRKCIQFSYYEGVRWCLKTSALAKFFFPTNVQFLYLLFPIL